MKNKIVLFLATALGVAAAGLAFAGEMEDLSTGAEKAFAQPVLAVTAAALPEASPAMEAMAAPAGSAEYKKLAADFAKGTAQSKEELTGWKAGRYLDRDFSDYPGSMLLASGEMQATPEGAKAYRIVPFTLNASPSFYETLNADMNAGLALVIKDQMSMWTAPVFTQAEAAFEKLMPSYDKGFSRYAVRKTADGRILVKNAWKSDMGGYAFEGVLYGYVTKNVTPAPVAAPARSGQYVQVTGRVNLNATGFMPAAGGFTSFTFNNWVTFRDLSGRITSNQTYIHVPFSAWVYPNQHVFQNVWVTGIYPQFYKDGKPLGSTHMSGFVTVSGWPGGNYVSLNGSGTLNGTLYAEDARSSATYTVE